MSDSAVLATSTLAKWGNSQGLIIPKHLCDSIGLKVGDKLDVKADSGCISITPSTRRFSRTRRYSIDELFDGYDGSYEAPSDWPLIGSEIDWGSPVGQEAW